MANNLIQGTTNISDISKIDMTVILKDGTKNYTYIDSNIVITRTYFTNGMEAGSWVTNSNADKKELARSLCDLTRENIGVVYGCSQSQVSQGINSVNHEEPIMSIPQEQPASENSQSEDEINTDYDIDDGNYRDEEERAQAEYSYYEKMWERIVMENK